MADYSAGHVPVLMREVKEYLNIQPGEVVVDATMGLAGHSIEFAKMLGSEGTLIGIDVDPANLAIAKERLADAPCRVELRQANFADLGDVLASVGIDHTDRLFADLGVSSTQLDQAERGFSFQHDGPLDMRMDPSLNKTATDLVNSLRERELSDVLFLNAQEMASRRIAKRICYMRRDQRITTTKQLADIVAGTLRINPESRKQKIHPATRTFQALRMAVNGEIPALESLLEMAPGVLRRGGRFVVIAFHSVEDKPVKLDFRRRKVDEIYNVLTKKPITAEEDERRSNPRSRSAKLRAVERL